MKQKVSDRSTWSSNYSLSKLKLKQIGDQDIACVYKYVEKSQRPDRSEVCSWSPASRHCMHLWDQLIILQGVMFQKFDKRDKTDQYLQLLTPHNLRKEIVTETNISHQTIFQIPMVKKMNSDGREDFLFSFSRFSDR